MSRGNNLTQRDEMLFRHYLEVLRSYGDMVRYVTSKEKFERAAMPFSISGNRAGRIIFRKLKEKGYNNYLSETECGELLLELQDLARSAKEDTLVYGLNRILIQVGVSKSHEEVKQLTRDFLIKNL